MKRFKPSQKLLIFIYVISILWFCHHFIFRPIILDWGSSQSIRALALSGDVFTDGKSHTRAVLIEATPEEIWPWLVQIGQDRGGFYSYQWLENIFQADMRNAYEIKREYQYPRKEGDTIWLTNKVHYNGGGYQILAEITPLRSMVMVGAKDFTRISNGEKAMGSWAFYLYPENTTKTWLIVRSSDGDLPKGNKVLRYFTFEVPHFIMERKMLVTMKRLVESREEIVLLPDDSITAK